MLYVMSLTTPVTKYITGSHMPSEILHAFHLYFHAYLSSLRYHMIKPLSFSA